MVRYRYLRVNLSTVSVEVEMLMLTVMVAIVDHQENVQVIVVNSMIDAISDVDVS
jgi:hypothetical protein